MTCLPACNALRATSKWVVAMVAMMGYTALWAAASTAMLAATTALGFGLLAWYAREN